MRPIWTVFCNTILYKCRLAFCRDGRRQHRTERRPFQIQFSCSLSILNFILWQAVKLPRKCLKWFLLWASSSSLWIWIRCMSHCHDYVYTKGTCSKVFVYASAELTQKETFHKVPDVLLIKSSSYYVSKYLQGNEKISWKISFGGCASWAYRRRWFCCVGGDCALRALSKAAALVSQCGRLRKRPRHMRKCRNTDSVGVARAGRSTKDPLDRNRDFGKSCGSDSSLVCWLDGFGFVVASRTSSRTDDSAWRRSCCRYSRCHYH